MRNPFKLTSHTMAMDGRDFWVYLQRFLLCASTFIMFNAVKHSVDTGATGLVFFENFFYLLAIFSTLGAVHLFSSAISIEKEAGVMDLLVITGMRPFDFLLGRFVARFCQILYLLFLQLPFCIFGITLGGVHANHLLSSFCLLIIWLFFIGMISYLTSVLYSNRKESLFVSSIVGFCLYLICAPAYKIADILKPGVTEFVFFDLSYIFLILGSLLFWVCCDRFEDNALKTMTFFKKRKERNRKRQLWIDISPMLRIVMKNKLKIRFSFKEAIKQKDDYLHPPPPLVPFKNTYVENPGCAILGGISLAGFGILMILGSPIALIIMILIYMMLKDFNRLVLVFNYELEDNTFQPLLLLPKTAREILKEKMDGALLYRKPELLLYVALVILVMFTQIPDTLRFAIVGLPALKLLTDYLVVYGVFKVRQAPKSVSSAAIIFLTGLFFYMPFVAVPLYTLGFFLFREKCTNEVALLGMK